MMIHKTNTSIRLLLHKFSSISVIISIFHTAMGNNIKYPDIHQSIGEFEINNSSDNEEDMNMFEHHTKSTNTIDHKYPYRTIMKIVKETKKILKSNNEEEKWKLKFGPAFYDKYISSAGIHMTKNDKNNNTFQNKRPQIISSNHHLHKDDTSCPTITSTYHSKPLPDRKGKKHYILENFSQKICVTNGKTCGKKYLLPIGYESKCEQKYKYVPLFSMPVDEELAIENQDVIQIKLGDGCVCTWKPID